MDKTIRAELLRLRLQTLFPAASKPQPKPKKPRRIWTPSRPFKTDDVCDAGSGVGAKRPGWIQKADPKPTPTVATKHRKGVPALAVIAAKAPKKLARTYPNAEAIMAARLSKGWL